MNLNLQGKFALVCGASQGIGRAIAESLDAEGVRLVLLARNEEKLIKLNQALQNKHEVLALDIAHLDQLETKLAEILKKHPIDIVVNNTAGPKAGPLHQAQEEDLAQAFQAHILTANKIMHLVLPQMQKNKFGRFINIVSTSTKSPIPGLGVSNTIRGAMNSWSKTLSYELAPFGVTVNNILPGFTKTSRLDELIAFKAKQKGIESSEEEKLWIKEVPAGRFAEPREIAHLACFLSSPLAAYINGTSIAVDGAKTLAF